MSAADISNVDLKQVSIGPVSVKIPTDWGLVTLDDVSENSGEYGANVSAESFDPNEFRYIRITDLTEDGQLRDDEKQSIPIEGNEKYRLEEGDLLFARTGAVGRTYLYSESDSEVPCAFAGYLIRFQLSDNIDHDYLRHYTNSEYFNKWVNSTARSTTHANINASEYSSVDIPYPPLPEQRRIADVLSKADEQIQQTDEIINTIKELRYGLRQDLVFGNGFADDYKSVRLGARNVEIPSDWEVATFSDVAAVEKGSTPKTSNSDYYGGDIVWVTPDDLSNMYDRGEKYISDSRRKITDAGLQSTSVNIVPAPSVMFTSRSYGIGKTAICTVPAATNQGIIAFHPKKNISVEYLYYYLNQIMDHIIAISGVSNFPEVSLTDIRSLRVPVPSKDDQERIESALELVDERLVEEQNTKRRLQELKRGLMQDLLTGKVRVNTD